LGGFLPWGGGGGGFLPWGGGGAFFVAPGGGIGGFFAPAGGFFAAPGGGRGGGGFSPFGGGMGAFFVGGTGAFFGGGGGLGFLASPLRGGGGGLGGRSLAASPAPGDDCASFWAAAGSSFSPDHQLDQEPAAAWAHSSATSRRRSIVVRVRYQTRAAISVAKRCSLAALRHAAPSYGSIFGQKSELAHVKTLEKTKLELRGA
jgi:hypothetical protein